MASVALKIVPASCVAFSDFYEKDAQLLEKFSNKKYGDFDFELGELKMTLMRLYSNRLK